MIPQNTIQEIFDTLKIEDVIGDFLPLKKRGVNFIGLCPFHNEKTPSFTVSPSKGIYKCFGCGVAGNGVKFLMEHEHYSYVESIKYLANKYHIEIEEAAPTEEELAYKNVQDSLFIVTSFAQTYFSTTLLDNEEGKTIGLAYLKERGFREDVIKKFQLGYCLTSTNGFVNYALEKGHQLELLKKCGLVTSKGNENKDFFSGRILFPVHNLSGKIIAFGGRTLKNNERSPKYINSPETDIYHKSKVLYGLFFSRNAIIREDSCYLVEGYTDVLSLHQANIENVIASSGTSLTDDQIRLIKRYTQNIVILYDGDEAGIKAALRGMEIILQQGLNVRIVLLPDKDDPDSFIRKKGTDGFKEFISKNGRDFVLFKTSLLLKESENDPVKKAHLIKEIVTTIAKIPDPIKRSLYIKECSDLFKVKEQILITETNKISRKELQKGMTISRSEAETLERLNQPSTNDDNKEIESLFQNDAKELHEKDIVRILLEHGDKEISENVSVASFILKEIEHIDFSNEKYRKILEEYSDRSEDETPQKKHFIQHQDQEISTAVVEILSSQYELSDNWDKMHNIVVSDSESNFREHVKSSISRFKLKKVLKMISENEIKMKEDGNEETIQKLQKVHSELLGWKQELCKELGTVII